MTEDIENKLRQVTCKPMPPDGAMLEGISGHCPLNTTIPGHQAVEQRLQHSLLSTGFSVPEVQINMTMHVYYCL